MACVFKFTCNEVVQHCDAWCVEVVKITLAACCVIFVVTKQYIIVSFFACINVQKELLLYPGMGMDIGDGCGISKTFKF